MRSVRVPTGRPWAEPVRRGRWGHRARVGLGAASLALVLASCGSDDGDRATHRSPSTTTEAAWPTTPCASLGLEGTAPRVGRCTQDGERVSVVERGTPVTAGDLTLKLAAARQRVAEVAAEGTFRVDLEVSNGADGPRSFEADAAVSAGGHSARFLPRSTSEVIGEPSGVAGETTPINPSVPVDYHLFYDAGRLGRHAPAVVTQSLPGAEPDEPARVAFLLRPAKATIARNATPRLRRTPSRAAGTPVEVAGARAVVPPGWERAETGLQVFRGRRGKSLERHFSVWVRQGRNGRSGILLLRAVRMSKAGRLVDRDPESFFAGVQKGFDVGLRGGARWRRSTARPGSDLGGRPAGALVALQPEGKYKFVVLRLLATGRGDTGFVVGTFAPEVAADRMERVAERVRASWSWR